MGVLKVVLIILGVLLTLVGLAGVGLYTAYTILPGPIYLRNNFIGLWLSILFSFYALEFIYCVIKSANRVISLCATVFNVAYYILVALGAAFVALGYGFVLRVDSIAIGVGILALAILSILVLMLRRRQITRNKLHPKTNKKMKTTTEMEQTSTRSNSKLLGNFQKDLHLINYKS